MADMAMVANSIAGTIGANIEYINLQMAQVGPLSVQRVLPFYKQDVAGSDYPIIMVNHIKEDNGWWALQDLYGTMYSLDVFGVLRGTNNPEQLDRMIDKMAGAVRDVLAAKNLYLPCENGQSPVFVDFNKQGYFPVGSIQYMEQAPGETPLTRAFKMRWKGTYVQQAMDIDRYLSLDN